MQSDSSYQIKPMICRHEHFLSPWYVKWARSLCIDVESLPSRKNWEWTAIAQALDERGMLQSGRCGIGFAVGREPLAAAFAARGVEVLGTDLASESSAMWIEGGQHASGRPALSHSDICEDSVFDRLVSFENADMRDLSALPAASFDFSWSSCAMEHLGTLKAGLDFVRETMRLLKPGGISIHSTEFNCSSNDATVEQGWNVLYRRRDIEELDRSLRIIRCGLEATDFNIGLHSYDLNYDEEPFFTRGRAHIKLLLDGYVSTSALIIARKAG